LRCINCPFISKKKVPLLRGPFDIISNYYTNKVPSGFPKIKVKEEVNFI
jgi:hypothetical protein